MNSVQERAIQILKNTYGPDSEFREGQLEAITAVVNKQKTLVIQKTGWGKSIVYFIATKILREHGAGPTIIISPLLALMHNQIEAAKRLDLNVVTINSNNRDEWDDIYASLNTVDAIIVSPEKLSNPEFIEKLGTVSDIEMVVVDEAHSISDWGHDFRPDYQRIVYLLQTFPDHIAILGTTATANDRVIQDIKDQLGDDLQVFRGDLIRDNISIQVNPAQSKVERLAFITEALTRHPFLSQQQGIIYCLTKKECDSVADFLLQNGISAVAYYSGVQDAFGEDISAEILEEFHTGKTRVIVSTVKLGMGYDKSNIGFVIHFQLPQNLIAYYQQIGRAGRDGSPALAILLHGDEDEEIIKSFIDSANKDPELLQQILQVIGSSDNGLKRNEILQHFNLNVTKLTSVLKYLYVHNYIYMEKSTYFVHPNHHFDAVKNAQLQAQLNETRLAELDNLKAFINFDGCYMKFIADELDAPDTKERCGLCAHCRNRPFVTLSEDNDYLEAAKDYKNKLHGVISPRKRWSNNKKIDDIFEHGWTYTVDAYSPIGKRFMRERDQGHYSDKTMTTISQFLKEHIEAHHIDAIVAVPSVRRPSLVKGLARQIALEHGISYVDVLKRSADNAPQREMHNSMMQEQNVRDSLQTVNTDAIREQNILLIDDIVDSRWTITIAASLLLEQGASHIYPFALVNTGSSD
ncbi:RecQ family ATP-dependent DNA helicase [Macrococcus hajekii]|uniref:DNA 3'-5' helicase n=1 Tax=Macrococcus hajekii TaxID=198482 RepID=A0A4V3BDW5_9STAP|nr:RecQ family ATP-dependent DNA helicase [Macrococcus hajekii]TDM01614.1 RecQ family ATP-dependent DNA helicase [Macrococcus hajekii]GGB01511.1 ATP-dependent DNA helicase RecG [Macrococcus hajekii]